MKQFFTILMAFAIATIPAMAEETNVCIGGIYYLLDSENHTAKVYYDDTTYGQTDRKYPNLKDLVIPSKVTYDSQEYVVTEIADYAFYSNLLWSVSLPETLTEISDYAFSYCTCLPSITLPETLTAIGSYAFEGCEGLTEINLPDAINSIGNGAFYE